MSQAQPYAPRKSGSPAAGARRNDSQDYLLLDAEPCEESALPPYAFYPVRVFVLEILKTRLDAYLQYEKYNKTYSSKILEVSKT